MPADWDVCISSGPASSSTGDATQGGALTSSSGGSGVPRVDSAGGSSHSGKSWAGGSSSAGALDGSEGSSSAVTEATATMLPRSRALAALFLKTKHQGVLTQTRPSQRLHLTEPLPRGEDGDVAVRPAGAPFQMDSADGDDFRGGWAGRLASACIDKAASGVILGHTAGAPVREASTVASSPAVLAFAHAAPLTKTGQPESGPQGGDAPGESGDSAAVHDHADAPAAGGSGHGHAGAVCISLTHRLLSS